MELLINIIQATLFSMLFGGVFCSVWMLYLYAKFLRDEENAKKEENDLTNS